MSPCVGEGFVHLPGQGLEEQQGTKEVNEENQEQLNLVEDRVNP